NTLRPNQPLQAGQTSAATQFTIELGSVELDFGDAPDPTYPSLFASDGARHIVSNLFLGSTVTDESDALHTPAADGDTDDGVQFITSLVPGVVATVSIESSAAGFIDAWIDFDGNGVWDAGEQIFASEPVTAGTNTLSFTVPVGA